MREHQRFAGRFTPSCVRHAAGRPHDRRRRYKRRILWNAITVEVSYDPDWMGTCDIPEHAIAHLEVRSLKPAGVALPVTETGYRSHVLPAAAVFNAGGQ